MKKHRLGILFSGGGTTAEAMAKAILENTYPKIALACAISSNPHAAGIRKLTALDIPVYIVAQNDFKTSENKIDRVAFGAEILQKLRHHSVTFVTQNGWIPLTPENVVKEYGGNIFNQHPGPLPEFGGKGMMGTVVHDAFLRFRKKVKRDIDTYVLTHRVTPGLDEGAVVKRTIVKVVPEDTVETLQQRALPVEHQTQLHFLQDIQNGRVKDLPYLQITKPGEAHLLEEAKKEAIQACKNH